MHQNKGHMEECLQELAPEVKAPGTERGIDGQWLSASLPFQYSHLFPSFPELSDADPSTRCAADVFHVQELVLFTEGQEMGEERIEMRFHLKME